jgi:hypothetical protein
MSFVEIPEGHIAAVLFQNLNVLEEARREIDPFLINEHTFARFIVSKIEAALLRIHTYLPEACS